MGNHSPCASWGVPLCTTSCDLLQADFQGLGIGFIYLHHQLRHEGFLLMRISSTFNRNFRREQTARNGIAL
jgi:hypothetical protein